MKKAVKLGRVADGKEIRMLKGGSMKSQREEIKKELEAGASEVAKDNPFSQNLKDKKLGFKTWKKEGDNRAYFSFRGKPVGYVQEVEEGMWKVALSSGFGGPDVYFLAESEAEAMKKGQALAAKHCTVYIEWLKAMKKAVGS